MPSVMEHLSGWASVHVSFLGVFYSLISNKLLLVSSTLLEILEVITSFVGKALMLITRPRLPEASRAAGLRSGFHMSGLRQETRFQPRKNFLVDKKIKGGRGGCSQDFLKRLTVCVPGCPSPLYLLAFLSSFPPSFFASCALLVPPFNGHVLWCRWEKGGLE